MPGLGVHRAAPVATRRVALAVVDRLCGSAGSGSPMRCQRAAGESRRTWSPSAARRAGDRRPAERDGADVLARSASALAPVDSTIAWIAGVRERRPVEPTERGVVVERILADVAARERRSPARSRDGSALCVPRALVRGRRGARSSRDCARDPCAAAHRRRRAADELAVLADAQAGDSAAPNRGAGLRAARRTSTSTP